MDVERRAPVAEHGYFGSGRKWNSSRISFVNCLSHWNYHYVVVQEGIETFVVTMDVELLIVRVICSQSWSESQSSLSPQTLHISGH